MRLVADGGGHLAPAARLGLAHLARLAGDFPTTHDLAQTRTTTGSRTVSEGRRRLGVMSALVPYMVLTGVLVATLGLFAWLARRIRRRGLAGRAMGAAMASYEEAFRVTAYDAHYEVRAQAERRAPAFSPDQDWRRRAPDPADQPVSHRPGPPRASRRRRLIRWAGHRRREA